MTKRELIAYCRQRDSEVCNECPYLMTECEAFVRKVGHVPGCAPDEEMTDEVII